LITAILQARMTSSRLPGKVLEPILGLPMLLRQIERIRKASRLDEIIVATSDQPSDDVIVQAVSSADVDCFRGSLDDVLDRIYQAAKASSPDHIVRLTGDCPLTDPEVIDDLVHQHLKENNDYTSNIVERSYPDGIDVEIMKSSALDQAWKNATRLSDREHVTPYLYRNPKLFSIGVMRCKQDLAELRWTVDNARDLSLIREIFARLYPENPDFSMWDVLELVEQQSA